MEGLNLHNLKKKIILQKKCGQNIILKKSTQGDIQSVENVLLLVGQGMNFENSGVSTGWVCYQDGYSAYLV